MALPRGATKQNGFNKLEQGLGENAPIDIQDVSDTLPKPPSSGTADRPDLMVDPGDLPATARELRDLLAASGQFFERGEPVKIVPDSHGGPPSAVALTANGVVMEAHKICRPCKPQGDDLVSVTLPERIGRMYLHLSGEWDLPPLAGITTAPVLSADGTVRAAQGYDAASQLWCATVPPLTIPEQPSREQAEAALRVLRETFRTFPFADALRRKDKDLQLEVVRLDQPPGVDESAFLVSLLTATCRPHLWLAPGFLVRSPEISGAGTGKGLLVRSICAIAFGIQPRAFTKGADRQELDKRLASDLIKAAQVLFLDNFNSAMLRSEILASVLTERRACVRPLGRTGMVVLNSTAFIAVTGNGLSVSEDLARRFMVTELDAQCEDPEQRPFATDFLSNIESRRAELLSATLTIWRWGRQHAAELTSGLPLGSFEQWAEWCRDPLLALGCRDPVERIDEIKSDDPHRRRIVELFETWHAHHGDKPVKANAIAEPVRALLDPQGRGRQFMASCLVQRAGTRVGGFVLTRQEAAGKWGAATYCLIRTSKA